MGLLVLRDRKVAIFEGITWKYPVRLLLLTGGLSITQAGFFMCYIIITEHFANGTFVMNFDVPGQDFCL